MDDARSRDSQSVEQLQEQVRNLRRLVAGLWVALVGTVLMRGLSLVFIATILAAFALVWTIGSGLREGAIRKRRDG